MTKEVLVTFCGLQSDPDGKSDGGIRTAARGDYYHKNGKHYVLCEETVEGLEERVKSRLKFDSDTVEVTRGGALEARMVFQKNKKHLTGYRTPFGQMLMGIVTREIRLTQRKEHITVEVDYALELNDEFLSDCCMVIDIRSAI